MLAVNPLTKQGVGLTLSEPVPSVLPPDEITRQIDEICKEKKPIIFIGFSGLDYEDREKLKEEITKILEAHIAEEGKHNLIIIAGATDDGIGMVYNIANDLGIKTAGIVSEQARGSTSEFCDHVIYVDDPDGSWRTEKNGQTYLCHLAKKAVVHVFSGGQVALNETVQLINAKATVKIHFDHPPSKEKVAQKLEGVPEEQKKSEEEKLSPEAEFRELVKKNS